MTKEERQNLIKDIISKFEFDTQNDLVDYLNYQGLVITQATVSRDIKEIGIKKVKGKQKKFRYIYDENQNKTKNLKLYSGIINNIVVAQNLIVIKTTEGGASSVASFLDKSELAGVLGTIAGDDTILVVTPSETDAIKVKEQLQRILI
jgi:transcriptional regulator of arginine metabolism